MFSWEDLGLAPTSSDEEIEFDEQSWTKQVRRTNAGIVTTGEYILSHQVYSEVSDSIAASPTATLALSIVYKLIKAIIKGINGADISLHEYV